MPLVLNILLFGLFLLAGIYGFDSWMHDIFPKSDSWWWAWLYYLIWIIFILFIMLSQVLFFTVVGRILAAPFLEALTKRVEQEVLGGQTGFVEMSIMRSILRTLRQECLRMLVYLVIMGGLLFLHLVPGLGSLAYSVLTTMITCFFLASEFLDYPMERRGLRLRDKLRQTLSLGLSGWLFGASLFIMAMIPIVNLAFLPAAAVGGTLLYLDRLNPTGGPPPLNRSAQPYPGSGR